MRAPAGLTGGIATGKSTVSAWLAADGARIVDADRIAHRVVEKGRPAWRQVVDRFGARIQAGGGEIDRRALGRLIFADRRLQRELEAIVHPHVFREMDRRVEQILRQNPAATIFLDVPLLFECGLDAVLAEVVVVYAPPPVQLERLMARDGIGRREALERIGAQMPIEEKRRRATRVIDNSGSRSEARRQAADVYRILANRDG